ncbi:MAG: signal transduction histidine kinase [Candidatus Krumholzibacteriia bacterium]|jgi:signal transduction histidine kinase
MICPLTDDQALDLGHPSAATRFMGAMQAAYGSPDLPLLALSITDTLPDFPALSRLSIIIDSENATALDSTWDRREASCLVMDQGGCAKWMSPEFEWAELVKIIPADSHQLLGGVGDWLGGDDGSAGSWCLLPIRASETIVAAVIWQGALGGEDKAAELVTLAKSISLVTGSWAYASTLALDLAASRRESQSLKRLNLLQGRFVAMASHEFKTPLTSITAYTDVLHGQLTDSEFPHAKEFLGVIKSEADRLLRMVHRILDFTRIEYGSNVLARQATELEPLVVETVRGLRPAIAEMDLKVSVSSDKNLPMAEVDADLIRQVLVNLIGNAVKFSPRGGAIVIKLSELESAVLVSVADEGPGIATDDIRRVFREFYRGEEAEGREPGSGLGLTIARHIVNLHGGHIEVRQRESGGSDFRFLVPKEMSATNALPDRFRTSLESNDAGSLVDELLRLIAEWTGSRAVSLLLRDDNGALSQAGSMGWTENTAISRPVLANQKWQRFMHSGAATTDFGALRNDLDWCPIGERANENMIAPLGTGEAAFGVVITGRRRDDVGYSAADLVQLDILSDVAYLAFKAADSRHGHTVDALRLLLKIRRSGVPTSTPEALELLAKLARRMELGEMAIRRVQYAAALHDAGMGRVEEEIVLGGATLDRDERDEVERHVEQGVDLMSSLLPDEATADVIRHHHEMYDGSGYPNGLAGGKIPLGSRLLAVIDAWYALTCERPYRPGMAPEAAMKEIASFAGSQFDPKVVHEFEAVLIKTGQLQISVLDRLQ